MAFLPGSPKKNIFSVSEAAEYLGVSSKTLRNWEKRGRLLPQRTPGGARRYTLSQLNTAQRGGRSFPQPPVNPQSTATVSEAASRLGVSPKTLRNWEDRGILTPKRTPGGARRYTEGQLNTVFQPQAQTQPKMSIPPTASNMSPSLLNEAAKSIVGTSRIVGFFFTLATIGTIATFALTAGYLYAPQKTQEIVTNQGSNSTPTASSSVLGTSTSDLLSSLLSPFRILSEKLMLLFFPEKAQEAGIFDKQDQKTTEKIKETTKPLLAQYLPLSGGTVNGEVTFEEDVTFKSNVSANLISANQLVIHGNRIFNAQGQIPALTTTYIANLDGTDITNVNADHLRGLEPASFLRSDEKDIADGQIEFTGKPGGIGVGTGSVYINPHAASPDYTLFGIAVDTTQKFKVDNEGDVAITGNVLVSGGSLTTDTTTFNLVNTVAITVNLGGAATSISLGSSSGTTTINHNLAVSGTSSFTGNMTLNGDLAVNGGDITTTATTATIFNTNATTLSLGGAATTLNLANGSGTTVTVGASTGTTTVNNALTVTGASTFTGNNTFNGRPTFTKAPTSAHTGTWAVGSSTWNQSDATIYMNPASAAADTNLLGIAVGGSVVFDVDAEGDIYGRNMILTGSVSEGTTTIAGDLSVEGNTTLGDATTDTLTVNPATLTWAGGDKTIDLTGAATRTLTLLNSTTSQVADLNLSDGSLVLASTTRITNAGVGTLITGTAIASQTFTTNNIADSGALTIASGGAGNLSLNTASGTLTTNATTITGTSATTITLGSTGTDTIILGNGGADTITIGGSAATGVSITDDNWSITTGGVANFVSVGATTAGTGAFTTLTSNNTTTIGNGSGITTSLGNSGGAAAINITSGTGSQTFTSSVATGTTTTSAFVFTDSSLTSGTGIHDVSSSITTGKLLDIATSGNTWLGNGTTNGLVDIASTSTAGTGSSSSILLNLARSGTNANATHTAYGVYSSVTNTGTTSTNIGGYFTASGATNNYAAIFNAGSVGIGTTAPSNKLEILSTTSPQLRVAYDTSNYLTVAVSNAGAVTLDATGASAGVTISDALTASTSLTVSAGGAAITGSPSGYTNEVRLGGTGAGGTHAISTIAASGTPEMYFDHRGALGNWYWRNTTSTAADTQRMALSATGVLTIAGGLTVTAGGQTITAGHLGISTAAISRDLIGAVETGSGDGTNFFGLHLNPIANATITNIRGINVTPETTATAITVSNVYGAYFNTGTKGATSTVTNQYGVYIDSQTLGGTSNYGLYVAAPSGSATDIGLYVAGGDYAAVFAAGDVGIGTTTPGANLHVQGSTGLLVQNATSVTAQLNATGTSTSATLLMTTRNAGGGATNWGLTASQASYISLGNTGDVNNSLNVTSGGNVGIGTTAPGYLFDVYSTSYATANAHVGNATTSGYLQVGGVAVIDDTSLPRIFGPTGETFYLGVTGDAVGGALNLQSGGNVGIGLSPSAKLEVAGAEAGGGSSIGSNSKDIFRISDSANSNRGLKFGVNSTTDDVGWIQYTLEGTAHKALALQPSGGNVGIGTPAPTVALVVNGGLGSTTHELNRQDAMAQISGRGFAYSGDNTAHQGGITAGISISANRTGPVASFNNASTTASTVIMSLYNGSTERVRFLDDGSVGIGTTSPGALLQVGDGTTNGRIKVITTASSSGGSALDIAEQDTVDAVSISASNASYNSDLIYGNTSRAANSAFNLLKLDSNAVNQLTLRGDGVLTLSGSTLTSTNADFNITSTGTNGNVYIKSNSAGLIYINNDTGTGNVQIGGASNTTDVTIYGTGTTCTIGNGTGATNCTSDIRLKENIQELGSELNNLLALRPITFNWIDKNKDQAINIGLIAQDVQQVFPNLVHEVYDGYLGIDYAGLVVPAIKAIQEQQAQITELSQKTEKITLDELGNLVLPENTKVVTDNMDLSEKLTDLEARLASVEDSQASQSALLTEAVLGASIDASSSAVLSQNIDNLTVNENITVLGTTSLSETNVAGKLSVGLVWIDPLEGTINSLTTLKFQTAFSDGVEIDMQGNLTVHATVNAQKYEVNTTSTTSPSAGKATIPQGTTSIQVDTTALTTNSLIFATPERPVAVSAKRIDTNTFELRLSAAESTDLPVNWWVVGVQ